MGALGPSHEPCTWLLSRTHHLQGDGVHRGFSPARPLSVLLEETHLGEPGSGQQGASPKCEDPSGMWQLCDPGGLEYMVSVTSSRLSLCVWRLRSGSAVARGSLTLSQACRGWVHPGPAWGLRHTARRAPWPPALLFWLPPGEAEPRNRLRGRGRRSGSSHTLEDLPGNF